MKKAEVVAIAPYAELQNTLKDVAEEFSGVMNTDIFLGDLSDAIKYVHNYSAKKYDLIISRGGTAKLLQSVAAVPVIEIETSAYDMLRAIRRAQQYNAPFLHFCATRSVTIEMDAAVDWTLDGEYEKGASHIKICNVPDAIRVMVPEKK